jgi:hypothetical protein
MKILQKQGGIMNSQKTLFGILCIVLIFGFVFLSCNANPDDSDGDPSPFIGTWYCSQYSGVTLSCEETTWLITIGSGTQTQEKGTYTYNGNNVTFTITHVKDVNTGDWVDQIPNPLPDPNYYGVYGITSLPQTFTGIKTGNQIDTTTGGGMIFIKQ